MGHLILDRKAGERIAIGDDISIEIVSMRSNRVKISITAPNATSVHRGEIYEKIKRQDKTDELSLALAIAGVISRAAEGGAQ